MRMSESSTKLSFSDIIHLHRASTHGAQIGLSEPVPQTRVMIEVSTSFNHDDPFTGRSRSQANRAFFGFFIILRTGEVFYFKWAKNIQSSLVGPIKGYFLTHIRGRPLIIWGGRGADFREWSFFCQNWPKKFF